MNIGFIGIGAMGRPMAVNLLKAGFHLTVYDLNQEVVQQLIEMGARSAATRRSLPPVQMWLLLCSLILMLSNLCWMVLKEYWPGLRGSSDY